MKVGLKQCKRIAPVQNYRRYWLLVDFPFGKGNGTQSRSSGIRWMEEYIVNKQSQACSTRGLERGWYRLLMRFLLLLPGLRPIQALLTCHQTMFIRWIKALYVYIKAPRTGMRHFSILLFNGFRRGTIDKTLFIKKNKSDIMLVQVYVDDIIFGSTTQSMCTEFEDCMHKRFQMSSMGELTFFLGLQVKQQPMESLVGQTRTKDGQFEVLGKGITWMFFYKKPNEKCWFFTEIVDFLKGTSLRIQELVASIDNKEYTITEASIRSRLQLADATSITNLPDSGIYEGLATLGGFAGEHVPLLTINVAGAAQILGPTVTPVADEATTTGVGVETEGATTTPSGLDAGMDSGNIHESSLRSHEAPFHKDNEYLWGSIMSWVERVMLLEAA
ncbi:putative ribonuclease H-like domain-containing protein [Tanacetum coccineum]|uniref:Ribonuclease H-like domain-containing protein n=1 Tax=Tanacetum coccineum TaxID=301880 RepID=A0ABQ5CY93_9ASTR